VPDSSPAQADTYLITLPSLHIEGLIFGSPFIELDGASYITSSTGYTAKVDYSGKGQADDLGSVKTTSMDLCMDACAKKASCTGCGWGVLDGDTGDAHSCWLKANLSNSHNATADWAFAVLLSH